MVDLITLLETTQNGDGVLYRGLIHQYLLEPSLQCCILLHVLAILIQGGGTHTVKFTARQRWFQHISSIHGAFSLASSHHGMDLVNKENHLTLLFAEIIEHPLETLLKLTAEFCPGNQCAHIEREQSFSLYPLWNLTIYNTLCQPLDNCSLSNPRLTDQHRIILGTAL